MYVYIYIYVSLSLYIHIYIYIYIGGKTKYVDSACAIIEDTNNSNSTN